MAATPTVVIAGAGIGGLTAALALARRGFAVVVLEEAPRLEPIGAGVQLSPNATRILFGLGLGARLARDAVSPAALRVFNGRSGREIVSAALGPETQARYGAPFWVIHRGDLQAALLEAVAAEPAITLRLGTVVAGHAPAAGGIAVAAKTRSGVLLQERAAALVGADGLRSAVRSGIGLAAAPRFRERTAWRATVPANAVPQELAAATTHLWLGNNAHLVHYPVMGGHAVNIVAVVGDRTEVPGWSAPGERAELLRRFGSWCIVARTLLEAPDQWRCWSLYDVPSLPRWGTGAVTLLGDAAHAALPFLAQGAAMAIEDAAVLAGCAGTTPDDLAAAFRRYEVLRQQRTARVTREARRTGRIYHLGGPFALARNLAMRNLGKRGLLSRYDWLYDWRSP